MAEEIGVQDPGQSSETVNSDLDALMDESVDDAVGSLTPTDDFVEDEVEEQEESGSPLITEEELTALREKASIVDQFQQNPTAVLTELAERLNLEVNPKGGGSSAPSDSTGNSPEDRARASLEKDGYGFMADAVIRAAKELNAGATDTATSRVEALEKQLQQREFEAAKARLNTKAPGWDKSEAEMVGLMNFLKEGLNGGPITHPKYGSVLDVLHQVVAGEGRATVKAVDRMARAAQNGISSSSSDTSRVDVTEQVEKAVGLDAKARIALRAAMSEMRNGA